MTINTTEAGNILNTQGVAAFYDYIDNNGDSYGRLGKEGTNNNSWQGESI